MRTDLDPPSAPGLPTAGVETEHRESDPEEPVMRRYDEPIEVKPGLVAGEEGPAHFLWRNRIWSVREIEGRWLETGEWWDGPAARAVRGDVLSDPGPDHRGGRRAQPARADRVPRDDPEADHDAGDDPSDEHEVWRVVAAPGRSAEHGVCELAHASGTGRWRLRTLFD